MAAIEDLEIRVQQLESNVQTLNTRVQDLETALHDFRKWVVFYDSGAEIYRYCNIGYCKAYQIAYLPTEYPNATQARAAANALNS